MHRNILDNVKGIGADTCLVLYLLAFEFGRAVIPFSMDGAFMSAAILSVIAMPYFFAWTRTDLGLGQWLLIRSGIAVMGLIAGAVFSMTLGVVFPDGLKYLPMLLLIASVAVSLMLNANNFLKLQLAK